MFKNYNAATGKGFVRITTEKMINEDEFLWLAKQIKKGLFSFTGDISISIRLENNTQKEYGIISYINSEIGQPKIYNE